MEAWSRNEAAPLGHAVNPAGCRVSFLPSSMAHSPDTSDGSGLSSRSLHPGWESDTQTSSGTSSSELLAPSLPSVCHRAFKADTCKVSGADEAQRVLTFQVSLKPGSPPVDDDKVRAGEMSPAASIMGVVTPPRLLSSRKSMDNPSRASSIDIIQQWRQLERKSTAPSGSLTQSGATKKEGSPKGLAGQGQCSSGLAGRRKGRVLSLKDELDAVDKDDEEGSEGSDDGNNEGDRVVTPRRRKADDWSLKGEPMRIEISIRAEDCTDDNTDSALLALSSMRATAMPRLSAPSPHPVAPGYTASAPRLEADASTGWMSPAAVFDSDVGLQPDSRSRSGDEMSMRKASKDGSPFREAPGFFRSLSMERKRTDRNQARSSTKGLFSGTRMMTRQGSAPSEKPPKGGGLQTQTRQSSTPEYPSHVSPRGEESSKRSWAGRALERHGSAPPGEVPRSVDMPLTMPSQPLRVFHLLPSSASLDSREPHEGKRGFRDTLALLLPKRATMLFGNSSPRIGASEPRLDQSLSEQGKQGMGVERGFGRPNAVRSAIFGSPLRPSSHGIPRAGSSSLLDQE